MNAKIAMLCALSSAALACVPAAQNASQRFVHLQDDVIVRHDVDGVQPLSRSTDGGRSWQPLAQQVDPLVPQDLVGSGDMVAIPCVFPNYSQGGPGVLISGNAGQSWVPRQVATWPAPTLGGSVEVRAHVDGDTVLVFWTEPEISAVYVHRSTDRGQTFQGGPVLLGRALAPSIASTRLHLDVVARGAIAHVFWFDNEAQGRSGRLQSTMDGGQTWLSVPRDLGPASSLSALIELSGTPEVLLLSDITAELIRSSDGGVTWTPATGLLLNAYADFDVERQFVAGIGNANPFQPTWIVHTSVDGGVTWGPVVLQVTTLPGLEVDLDVVGDDIFVAFHDRNQPTTDLIMHSPDRGATWRSLGQGEGILSVGPERMLRMKPGDTPRVDCGWTPLGGATTGAGSPQARLGLSSLPVLGRTLSLEVRGVLGGSVGALGLSASNAAPVPFVGGQVWLDVAFVSAGFVTAGGSGGGRADVPLAIPNVALLAGAELHAQAVVLDPQGPGGLALGPAVRLHLR